MSWASITPAAVIYDNTTTDAFASFEPFAGVIVGDEVDLLASAERRVTQVDVLIESLDPPQTGDTWFYLFENDGAGGAPGTPLFSVDLGSKTYAFGASVLTIAVPGVLVPDTITWALSFSNFSGAGRVGLALYDPPTVGSSADYYWYDDGSGFQMDSFGPIGVANFGARIHAQAVPEPATAFLFMFIAGVPLRRRDG